MIEAFKKELRKAAFITDGVGLEAMSTQTHEYVLLLCLIFNLKLLLFIMLWTKTSSANGRVKQNWHISPMASAPKYNRKKTITWLIHFNVGINIIQNDHRQQ